MEVSSRFQALVGGPDSLEHDPGFADVAKPPQRVLFETPSKEAVHSRWHRVGQCSPIRLLLEDRGEHVGHRVSAECSRPREHFVQYDAQTENI